MRCGSLIAGLCVAMLAVPGAASAKVTPEDRAFAHAFERVAAAYRAASADPAALSALHARQQAAAGCLDVAQALAAADKRDETLRSLDALVFYYFHAVDPMLDAVVRADDAYIHEVRRMHLRDRTLRSARAVLVIMLDVKPPAHDVLADFCGPLRAWQASGFAESALPAPFKAMRDFVKAVPQLSTRRHATLRRAVARMRAAGMPLAVRKSFVQGQADLPLDSLLHGDAIVAALGAS
jgi:hypothetical protein